MNKASFDKKFPLDLFHILTVVSFLVLVGIFAMNDKNPLIVGIAVLFLAMAVAVSIHHAEIIARKVGPSLGGLILAISVTIIEVGLILSMMSNNTSDSIFVARDTVFSAIIIVTNGILGVCFLVGGLRHKELKFQVEGTSSLMAVLATLTGLTLILPNFTTSAPGPFYSTFQLIFASVASLVLYGSLLISQTITHKNNFNPPVMDHRRDELHPEIPSRITTIFSAVGLFISLFVVIGFAKSLAPSIEKGVLSLGAPRNVVGVVIALLVLLPEAGAAITSARANQLQSTLNLALGSGVASIALTIPVISAYSILADRHVALGLDAKGMAFAAITFIVGGLTLSTGKVTALKGIVHLMLLFAYLALSFVP